MNLAKRSGILAGGVWLIDSTKYIDRYPEASRLATISEVVHSNGGGAFNVLVDLAKLQGHIPLAGVGSIGNDVQGEWILEQCRQHGIDVENMRRQPDQSTACTDVMTEIGSGRRTFFYQPGANGHLERGYFPLERSNARILYLGYPGLLPLLDAVDSSTGRTGVIELLDHAQQRGFFTAIDLVSAEACNWISLAETLPFVDLLFVNEWEAAKLLRLLPISEEAVSASILVEMGLALMDCGVRKAAIVHCSRGAVSVVSGRRSSVQQGAVRVPAGEIRGTCGAGDALAAGFLLGFHRDEAWSECLELATCAAATSLHHLSSSGGIRPWQDCLAYGRRQGFCEFS